MEVGRVDMGGRRGRLGMDFGNSKRFTVVISNRGTFLYGIGHIIATL